MAAGTDPGPVDADRPEAQSVEAERVKAERIAAERLEPERLEAERLEPERLEIDPAGWDDRQLCPDGACIGVIGADGRCTVCSTVDPTWSPDRPRAAAPVEATPSVAAVPAASDGSDEPVAWDDRQLCPDGACIGVIGADGRCTVCGTTAPAASASAT